MKRPIPHGFLVAIEGIDGAGKTSIATLLTQWCGERGLGCVLSKEPTSLKWGREMRESGKAGRLPVEREIELFICDRRDHVSHSIVPALAEGNIVILDRYYWSSAAYQGGRGANYHDVIAANEAFAPIPDLILLLDVEVDAGLQRIRMRGDTPNLFEGKASLTRARQIFQQLEAQNDNAHTIDTSGHLKQTFEQALRIFQRVAVDKIAKSGPIHPEMINLVLEFFGGEPLADMNVLPAELKQPTT